eukprot:3407905-Rhodomonas_salina.1
MSGTVLRSAMRCLVLSYGLLCDVRYYYYPMGCLLRAVWAVSGPYGAKSSTISSIPGTNWTDTMASCV